MTQGKNQQKPEKTVEPPQKGKQLFPIFATFWPWQKEQKSPPEKRRRKANKSQIFQRKIWRQKSQIFATF